MAITGLFRPRLLLQGTLLSVLTIVRDATNIEDRVVVELAAAALGDGFDFADALHHASACHCTRVATFHGKRFARRATAKSWKPSVKWVAI